MAAGFFLLHFLFSLSPFCFLPFILSPSPFLSSSVFLSFSEYKLRTLLCSINVSECVSACVLVRTHMCVCVWLACACASASKLCPGKPEQEEGCLPPQFSTSRQDLSLNCKLANPLGQLSSKLLGSVSQSPNAGAMDTHSQT